MSKTKAKKRLNKACREGRNAGGFRRSFAPPLDHAGTALGIMAAVLSHETRTMKPPSYSIDKQRWRQSLDDDCD